MTFTEILFSIPGLIALTLVGPAILGLIIQTARNALETEYEAPSPTPVPKDQIAMSIRDTEALAFISNHPAMRFHRKS